MTRAKAAPHAPEPTPAAGSLQAGAPASIASDSELLQKLLYNIPVMIRYADQQGRIAWVNREWERCLGWSLAEAQQKDVLAEMYPDPAERERVRRFIGGVSSKGWRDFRTRVRDGRVRDTTWANVILSDGSSVGIGQDVTERKRRATQLQALADAALAIGAATSIPKITEVATEAARQVIGAHCSVTSFTEQNWSQAIIASSFSEKYAHYRSYDARPDGTGIYRLVCEAKRPMRLTQAELEAHPAWRGFGREAARHPPLRGWLAAPLIGRDGSNLGVIQLSDKYEGEFDEDDEAILVQLAQLASEAVENARLLREVTSGRERLEVVSRRLVTLQEEERRITARELHDEVGQILTGLKLMLEARPRGEDVSELTDLVAQLQQRVRDLSLNLRPPMLDDHGLVPTLIWHFERYRSQTRIEVRFHHRGIAARLPAETEIAAFRIIQEALTNVARHAGVLEATVELRLDGTTLELRVEDEGVGFEPGALTATSGGLSGMRERALLAGGCLSVDSQPGAGTRLLARLSVPESREPLP